VLNALIFGHDQQNAPLIDKPADEIAIGVLDYLKDDSLGPAPSVGAHNSGANPVTVHGLKHFFGRNEDIVATCIRPHKSEAIAMADQPAIKAGL
jgi:hypothetical protein